MWHIKQFFCKDESKICLLSCSLRDLCMGSPIDLWKNLRQNILCTRLELCRVCSCMFVWFAPVNVAHMPQIHYSDVMMSAMASQITSVLIVYSTVCSDAGQRKHQSSASLAFVWRNHRWPVNSPHIWPSKAGNVSIWWRHHVTSLTLGESYHAHGAYKSTLKNHVSSKKHDINQITGNWTVCSIDHSNYHQRKYQSPALLAICERDPMYENLPLADCPSQKVSNEESLLISRRHQQNCCFFPDVVLSVSPTWDHRVWQTPGGTPNPAKFSSLSRQQMFLPKIQDCLSSTRRAVSTVKSLI